MRNAHDDNNFTKLIPDETIVNQVYEQILETFKIPKENVTAVVTDSAKDMNALGRLISSPTTSHHNCVDHVLSKLKLRFSC